MFNFFKNNKKDAQDESILEQQGDFEYYPKEIKDLVKNGISCDEIPNAVGEFGRSPTNPIPVNGARGEIKYIKRLRSMGCGMIFHRLGSFRQEGFASNVDVYELVTLDGSFWDVLYFDMYHPRRSLKFPKGYFFAEYNDIFDKVAIGFGVNMFDKNFPFGLPDLMETQYGSMGKALAERLKDKIADSSKFVRPIKQQQLISVAQKLIEYSRLSFEEQKGKTGDNFSLSQKDVQTLKTLWIKKDFEKAIMLLTLRDKQHPASADIWYYFGYTWRLAGNIEEAIRSYKISLQIDPYNKTPLYSLGIALQLIGEMHTAIRIFEDLTNKYPDFVEAYNSLALTHKKFGEEEKAIKYYNQALETLFQNIYDDVSKKQLSPINFEHIKSKSQKWIELATQIAIKNGAKDSIKEVRIPSGETVVKLLKQNPLIGVVLFDKDGIRHILPAYFSCFFDKLKLNLLYSTILNNLGTLFAENGSYSKARQCFEESIEFVPPGVNFKDPEVGLNMLPGNM